MKLDWLFVILLYATQHKMKINFKEQVVFWLWAGTVIERELFRLRKPKFFSSLVNNDLKVKRYGFLAFLYHFQVLNFKNNTGPCMPHMMFVLFVSQEVCIEHIMLMNHKSWLWMLITIFSIGMLGERAMVRGTDVYLNFYQGLGTSLNITEIPLHSTFLFTWIFERDESFIWSHRSLKTSGNITTMSVVAMVMPQCTPSEKW